MLSFYGGQKGDNYVVNYIFKNYAELTKDLEADDNSPVGLNELVLISYGAYNSPEYEENKELDGDQHRNGDIYQKIIRVTEVPEGQTPTKFEYKFITNITGLTPQVDFRMNSGKLVTYDDYNSDPTRYNYQIERDEENSTLDKPVFIITPVIVTGPKGDKGDQGEIGEPGSLIIDYVFTTSAFEVDEANLEDSISGIFQSCYNDDTAETNPLKSYINQIWGVVNIPNNRIIVGDITSNPNPSNQYLYAFIYSENGNYTITLNDRTIKKYFMFRLQESLAPYIITKQPGSLLMNNTSHNSTYGEYNIAAGSQNTAGTKAFEIIGYEGYEGGKGRYEIIYQNYGPETPDGPQPPAITTNSIWSLKMDMSRDCGGQVLNVINEVTANGGRFYIEVDGFFANHGDKVWATHTQDEKNSGHYSYAGTLNKYISKYVKDENSEYDVLVSGPARLYILDNPSVGNTEPWGNSVAFGAENSVQGDYAFASGIQNKVSGRYGAAIGKGNVAGYADTAIGRNNNIGFSQNSFSQGESNVIDNFAKHTSQLGFNLKSSYDYQTQLGKFNENKENNVVEVGYGTSEKRENIFEVDRKGRVYSNGNEILAPTRKINKVYYPSKLVLKGKLEQLTNEYSGNSYSNYYLNGQFNNPATSVSEIITKPFASLYNGKPLLIHISLTGESGTTYQFKLNGYTDSNPSIDVLGANHQNIVVDNQIIEPFNYFIQLNELANTNFRFSFCKPNSTNSLNQFSFNEEIPFTITYSVYLLEDLPMLPEETIEDTNVNSFGGNNIFNGKLIHLEVEPQIGYAIIEKNGNYYYLNTSGKLIEDGTSCSYIPSPYNRKKELDLSEAESSTTNPTTYRITWPEITQNDDIIIGFNAPNDSTFNKQKALYDLFASNSVITTQNGYLEIQMKNGIKLPAISIYAKVV